MKLISKLTAATFLSLSLAGPVAAASTITPDQLKAMVTDLGYQPTMDKDSIISIENQGKGKQTIRFSVSGDKTVVYVNVPFAVIPADKKAKIPMEAILKANGGFYYYAMGGDSDVYLVLYSHYDAPAVNKVTLRGAIDGILEAADTGELLWNPEKWTDAPPAAAPAAPASPAAAAPAAPK